MIKCKLIETERLVKMSEWKWPALQKIQGNKNKENWKQRRRQLKKGKDNKPVEVQYQFLSLFSWRGIQKKSVTRGKKGFKILSKFSH